MTALPEKSQQIIQAHAGLIHRVVIACHNRSQVPDLEQVLQIASDNGWAELVKSIRRVLNGRRDAGVFVGLDEDDQVVVEAILRGIQDPNSLPDLNAKPDPTLAAPGLASMIFEAGRGNTQALQVLGGMAQQMSAAGGDMARLAAIMRPLVNGERDPDRLCKGMSSAGETLVLSILRELGRLQPQ